MYYVGKINCRTNLIDFRNKKEEFMRILQEITTADCNN